MKRGKPLPAWTGEAGAILVALAARVHRLCSEGCHWRLIRQCSRSEGTGSPRRVAPRFVGALALAAALWVGGSAPAAETPAAPAPATGTDAARGDVAPAALRDFLVGPDRTLSTRRDAAEALLDKDTPAARAVLVQVLTGPMPQDVTLAVLEALAARDKAGEEFVEPLFTLLRSEDEPVRRGAAAAFGAYQGNDRVLGRLSVLAASAEAPQAQRLAAGQGPMADLPLSRPELQVQVPRPDLSRFNQLLFRGDRDHVGPDPAVTEDQPEAVALAGDGGRARQAGS